MGAISRCCAAQKRGHNEWICSKFTLSHASSSQLISGLLAGPARLELPTAGPEAQDPGLWMPRPASPRLAVGPGHWLQNC